MIVWGYPNRDTILWCTAFAMNKYARDWLNLYCSLQKLSVLVRPGSVFAEALSHCLILRCSIVAQYGLNRYHYLTRTYPRIPSWVIVSCTMMDYRCLFVKYAHRLGIQASVEPIIRISSPAAEICIFRDCFSSRCRSQADQSSVCYSHTYSTHIHNNIRCIHDK